jgi:hypothetical protein
MDMQTAEKVREGDVVLYRGKAFPVRSIVFKGLWGPYFELPEVGIVSHELVSAEGRPHLLDAAVLTAGRGRD